MKVTAIETIRLEEFPNLLWVRVETDQGLTGLGETFYGAASAEAHIHAIVAPPTVLCTSVVVVARQLRTRVHYRSGISRCVHD